MKFDLNFGLKEVGTTLAIGLGVAILAPVVLPVVASVVKPIVKSGIKAGIMLVEKGRVIAEEAKESIEDITAEARTELSEGQK